MIGRLILLASTALALASCSGPEPVRVVGSSTVYPFTTAVAEAFAKSGGDRKAPVIESSGSAAGFARFCEVRGTDDPDIVDASRRMKRTEFEKCKTAGVGDIMEILIGLDGLAFAESTKGPKFQLSRKDIYLALAANPRGKPNSTKTWRDVNPALPALPILVLGPPSTSGTRDALIELVLEQGCYDAMPTAKDLINGGDPKAFEDVCGTIRGDGAYADQGEDDELIVQGLEQNPNALGVFGYSYLAENTDRLRGIPLDGVPPTPDAIASGKYPAMRGLYLYVKKASLQKRPELQEFLNLYAKMWGPDGRLTKIGLVAASERVRQLSAEVIQQAIPLDPEALP